MLEKTSKINGNSTDTLTKYDIHSIMHYDGTLRGYFSNPVLTDKITGKGIPVNREMSPLDIQKLNKMYPCKPIGPACGKCIRTSCFTIFDYCMWTLNRVILDDSYTLRSCFHSSNAK